MTRRLSSTDPREAGPYRLLAELGRGGMGRVYLGAAPDGRLAAVKQVHARFAHDEGFRARFRREVDASRKVSGACTAAVLAADADAPVPLARLRLRRRTLARGRGGTVRQPARRDGAAPRRSARDGPGRDPPGRGRPPRPEAGERPALGGRRPGHRLRDRPDRRGGERHRAHGYRPGGGLPRLHVARAGRGEGAHPGERRVLARLGAGSRGDGYEPVRGPLDPPGPLQRRPHGTRPRRRTAGTGRPAGPVPFQGSDGPSSIAFLS
ncbi:hypothetical protein LSPH26S_02216 [Lysinibacillus sphaericus]